MISRLSPILLIAFLSQNGRAWSPNSLSALHNRNSISFLRVSSQDTQVEAENVVSSGLLLDQQAISNLKFRQLHFELASRDLPTHGTTGQLRERLRQAVLPDQDPECIVNEDGIDDDCVSVSWR